MQLLRAFQGGESGGELRVSCPDPNVRRVFEITGVVGFVHVDEPVQFA